MPDNLVPWYTLGPSAQSNTAILDIFGPIGGMFASDPGGGESVNTREVVAALSAIRDDVDHLIVRVNSDGGDAFAGIQIAQVIHAQKQAGRRVTVQIGALVGSAATLITSAGDTIQMPENAMMLVHEPRLGIFGTAGQLDKSSAALDKVAEAMVKIYSWVSPLSAANLRAIMRAETWMTAEEALAFGFITEITEEVAIAASMSEISSFDYRRLTSSIERAETKSEVTDYILAYANNNSEATSMPDEVNTAKTEVQETLPVIADVKAEAPEPTPAPAAPKAEAPAAPAPIDTEAIVTAERERAASIREVVASAGLERSFADEMIDAGTPVADANAKVLKKLTTNSAETATRQASGIQVGADRTAEGRVNDIEAAIFARSPVARAALDEANDNLRYGDRAIPVAEATSDRFQGRSLLDMSEASLESATPGSTRGINADELVAMTVKAAAGGFNTRSDFSTALQNAFNKTLRASYRITPDTWRSFCSVRSLNDLRPHIVNQAGYMSVLDEFGEGGEIKTKDVPDTTAETIQAKRYGNIARISAEAFINDDLGVLDDTGMMLGRASKLSVESAVYALLAQNSGLGPNMADGNTLYHASHNNISGGAAFSATAIEADRVVLAKQTDRTGNEILDQAPHALVIPIDLEGIAKSVNDSQLDPDSDRNATNVSINRFSEIVATARLSGTRRYMFVNPAVKAVLEVGFRGGMTEPTVQTRDSWNYDGVEYRIVFDFGVAATDFVGSVTDAGA